MQNQSLNGKNLIWIAVKDLSNLFFRYCMLNNFAVARGQEIHGGLSSTSRFEHSSFFVLSYLYNDWCFNAPFFWSLLMTGFSKHWYFNFIFLRCSVLSNFSSLSFSTKQNSISIGQKIHTKFHHHYKNTKTTLKRK